MDPNPAEVTLEREAAAYERGHRKEASKVFSDPAAQEHRRS